MALICIQCNKEKEDDEFYRHPQMKSGYTNVCKVCHKWRMRQRARTNPAVQAYDIARAKTPERKAASALYSKEYRKRYPERYKAHNVVNNAIRDGKLRKQPCEVCGAEYVHAHHEDYARPLDVRWLCPKHHIRGHSDYGEVG